MDIVVEQPLQVFVDNQACVVLSNISRNHGKTKHFALKVHFIWKLFENRLFELNYSPTDRMPADTLTKALGRTKNSLFCDVFLASNTSYDWRAIECIILIA